MKIRNKIKAFIAHFKSPKYIWGYRDSSGEFRPNVQWSDTVEFYNKKNIKIADNVFLAHYVILDGSKPISIGEGTQLGARVIVYTHSTHMAIRMYGRHKRVLVNKGKGAYTLAPVKIGQYVFVGAGSIIMAGVTLGDGCIIAAGSLIQMDIESRSIVKGNPARIVGKINQIDQRFLKKHPEFKEYYYDQEFLRNF